MLVQALTSYPLRKELSESFLGFCLVYLHHYFYIEPALFHPELLRELSDESVEMLLVEGFRGSAKSTLSTLALPLYKALKRSDRYPFIIIVGDTQIQSSMNIANIKSELDDNLLVKQDFGDIKTDDVAQWRLGGGDEWQSQNMVLTNGVRITARSRGQKVRGLRHRQHRPKLIIVDDPEDLEWVQKKENRDKTERWFNGEVLPASDLGAKIVVVGNHLHRNALMARLSKNKMFKRLAYALIDKAGKCLWPAKYPTKAALDKEKAKVGNRAWMREYMLKVIPDEGQEVTEKDIKRYDVIPKDASFGMSGSAFDLAISKKQTADYTAVVSGRIAEIDGKKKIYIDPNPINARMGFRETVSLAQSIIDEKGGMHMLFVENVAYQQAAIEEMEANALPVTPVKPIGDKRARLKIAAAHIKSGTVVFPEEGCEDLIHQLLGFGVEQHDDLVDSLVYLILELVKIKHQTFEVIGL